MADVLSSFPFAEELKTALKTSTVRKALLFGCLFGESDVYRRELPTKSKVMSPLNLNNTLLKPFYAEKTTTNKTKVMNQKY